MEYKKSLKQSSDGEERRDEGEGEVRRARVEVRGNRGSWGRESVAHVPTLRVDVLSELIRALLGSGGDGGREARRGRALADGVLHESETVHVELRGERVRVRTLGLREKRD